MKRGVREVRHHTKGEGAGDPIGSPVPFNPVSLRSYPSGTIGGIYANNPTTAARGALFDHRKMLIADRKLALTPRLPITEMFDCDNAPPVPSSRASVLPLVSSRRSATK